MKPFDAQPKGGETVTDKPVTDPQAMSLTALADHIEQTHHAYLRNALPRLASLIAEVVSSHAEEDSQLYRLQEVFRVMALELWSHMMKEEMCLFPMIRQLEASDGRPQLRVGTIADPIRQMELEHDRANASLTDLREVMNGYTLPDWACETYRAMLADFRQLERDMHVHVQKENNELFPRALELEAKKLPGPLAS